MAALPGSSECNRHFAEVGRGRDPAEQLGYPCGQRNTGRDPADAVVGHADEVVALACNVPINIRPIRSGGVGSDEVFSRVVLIQAYSPPPALAPSEAQRSGNVLQPPPPEMTELLQIVQLTMLSTRQ